MNILMENVQDMLKINLSQISNNFALMLIAVLD